MKIEDYKRLVTRMNEIRPSDKAAILLTMDRDLEVHTATFGEPGEVAFLRKAAAYANLNVKEGK